MKYPAKVSSAPIRLDYNGMYNYPGVMVKHLDGSIALWPEKSITPLAVFRPEKEQ